MHRRVFLCLVFLLGVFVEHLYATYSDSSSSDNLKRSSDGAGGILVDESQVTVQFPNPTYTFHEDLEYYPYKKIVSFTLLDFFHYTLWILKSGLKLFTFGFDIVGILLKLLGLFFDLNALRKTTIKYDINAHLSDDEYEYDKRFFTYS